MRLSNIFENHPYIASILFFMVLMLPAIISPIRYFFWPRLPPDPMAEVSYFKIFGPLLYYLFWYGLFFLFIFFRGRDAPVAGFFAIIIIGIAIMNTMIFYYAGVYRSFGIIGNSECKIYNSFDCLYFSLVTWTTLGYGDFAPTEKIRLIAGIEALMGYVFMAIFIGLILSFLTESKRDFKAK